MDAIAVFVKSIYKYECGDFLYGELEDEQKFPDRKTMEQVCEILLNVSCMREEGRFPAFRVCFVKPDSELLYSYIYAHALLFKEPIEFNTRNLHKLAPSLNPDMSYVMVDVQTRPFKMVGIIAAYTMWEKIMTREISSGIRMPRIPNIFVNGPGELWACLGEAPIVNYSAGNCIFLRTDTFTSTLISEKLQFDTRVSQKERLQLLYMVLWQMKNYGHGGAILIIPDIESCTQYLDIKYEMYSRYLFDDDDGQDYALGRTREKEIVTYADLIAKLSCVDGSVVLSKNLDLLGFGAEIIVDKMDNKLPPMRFIGYNDQDQEFKRFQDQGMRHRAAYRFCSVVEDGIAFTVSQDGMIEASTKHEGKVVVYDNVALPLI